MMSVKIAPEEPMRAPTTVSRGLSIMKPSAQRAHPEYELSTVITCCPVGVFFVPSANEVNTLLEKKGT